MSPKKKTYLEKQTAEFDRVLAEINKQHNALIKDGKFKRKSQEQLIAQKTRNARQNAKNTTFETTKT